MPSSLHSSHGVAEIFLARPVGSLSSKMKFNFILEYILNAVLVIFIKKPVSRLHSVICQDGKEKIKVFKWSKLHVLAVR